QIYKKIEILNFSKEISLSLQTIFQTSTTYLSLYNYNMGDLDFHCRSFDGNLQLYSNLSEEIFLLQQDSYSTFSLQSFFSFLQRFYVVLHHDKISLIYIVFPCHSLVDSK